MQNFILTLEIILPIFLLMVVGQVCRRGKLVTTDSLSIMNKLVFRIFLPCSLANSIASVDPSDMPDLTAMLFCAVSACVICLGGFLIIPRLVKENNRRGVLIQGLYRSNYAIFGLPLAQAIYPEGDGGIAAIMVLATVPVFNVLAVFTLETYREGKFHIGKVLLGVLKNPLIWGCFAGMVMMFLPFDLPSFAVETVQKLGSIASPFALFVLGASLDMSKVGGNLKALVGGVGARLVLVPLVFLTAAYLLGFRGPTFSALMIAFGSPCAVSSYTMAAQMGGDEDLASQLVLFSTVFSSVTMFLLIFTGKTIGVF